MNFCFCLMIIYIVLTLIQVKCHAQSAHGIQEGLCCTIIKGNGNAGCLLHYAHVLYDFIIPFDWELHHSNYIQDCKYIYIPQFPLIVLWMSALYPDLPLLKYGPKGSCQGIHSSLKNRYIELSSVDIIRTIYPREILNEFRLHVLSKYPNINCPLRPFSRDYPMKIIIIDRSMRSGASANFTSLCRYYNKNLRRWLGHNMPIRCGCQTGDSRGSLQYPEALVYSIQGALLHPSNTSSVDSHHAQLHLSPYTSTARPAGSEVVLQRLDGLSVPDVVETFCQASIIIGNHGAGLLNTVFAPPGALLIEVPRDGTGGHSTMMASHCAATGKTLVRLDRPTDFNGSVALNYAHASLNITHILRARLASFDWFRLYFRAL